MECLGGTPGEFWGKTRWVMKAESNHGYSRMPGQGICPQFNKLKSLRMERAWLELCLGRHGLSWRRSGKQGGQFQTVT